MQTASPVITCASPTVTSTDRILLAHGEGGRLMRRLIRESILPTLDNEYLRTAGDAALLPVCRGPLAMTTDSFVVSPLFFPGGDIGTLAVFGTANDLAVAGATPRWISLSLILEEGLEVEVLERVLASVASAARRIGVSIVTGDTKVVPRGAADQLFINTTGVGEIVGIPPSGPQSLAPDDELIVTGPIGRHGIAVLAAREGLDFEPPPETDCAPLLNAVAALRKAAIPLRAIRDATRGGLAAVLHEWAEECGHSIVVENGLLPVTPDVRGACELLGLDPIHVANEGTMVVGVPRGEASRAVEVLRGIPESSQSARIGAVVPRKLAGVVVRRGAGREIPLDEPVGAPLPRIC